MYIIIIIIIIIDDNLSLVSSQAIFDVLTLLHVFEIARLGMSDNPLTLKACHRVHFSTFN